MRRFRRSTRALTGARLELAMGRNPRRIVMIVVVLAGLIATGLFGLEYFERHWSAAERLGALEARQVALQEELAHARLALEVEKATRAEVERQLLALSRELQELQAELSFYKAQGKPGR